MDVNITGGKMPDGEVQAYVDRARELYTDRRLTGIDIKIDGEYADLTYHWAYVPFERIRRITGYLVGSLDRFNNAKRSEETDRVKHV
jgi:hypothetical protein